MFAGPAFHDLPFFFSWTANVFVGVPGSSPEVAAFSPNPGSLQLSLNGSGLPYASSWVVSKWHREGHTNTVMFIRPPLTSLAYRKPRAGILITHPFWPRPAHWLPCIFLFSRQSCALNNERPPSTSLLDVALHRTGLFASAIMYV